MIDIYNKEEFEQGRQDCINGVPHQSGKGESYDAGYGFEYQLVQIMGSRCND